MNDPGALQNKTKQGDRQCDDDDVGSDCNGDDDYGFTNKPNNHNGKFSLNIIKRDVKCRRGSKQTNKQINNDAKLIIIIMVDMTVTIIAITPHHHCNKTTTVKTIKVVMVRMIAPLTNKKKNQ